MEIAMQCIFCETQNPEGALFCKKCGRRLDGMSLCAACGKTAWVPFQPRPEQLVYCAKCYAAMREEWEEERRR